MKSSKKRFWLKFMIIFTLTISISAFFIPWRYLIIRFRPLSKTVQAEIDYAVEKQRFIGIIAYVNDGVETTIYTAGYNDKDAKTSIEPDVLFKIASISKLYMAVAATKMIDQGLLNVDDTIEKLLPAYKDSIDNADEITLKMLIQHRSGIRDYIDSPSFPWATLPQTKEEVLPLILNQKALFEPNQKYDYSNSNYLLLAMIMDDVLGYTHDIFIKKEILDKHNLTNTYYYYSEANPANVMSGYELGYPYDLKQNDHITPGGTMVASIRDVGRFIRILNDGSLLSSSEQALYQTLYPLEHTGLLPGYQSIAKYDKETDQVIILFTNTSGKDSWFNFELIYQRIKRILSK